MVLAADDWSSGALNDFFGSGTWSVARNLGIFLVVVFWLAVGYWVFKDARRRIEDPWLVGAGDGARPGSAVHRRADLHALPPPSTSRTCASGSSRSRRWRRASARPPAAVPGLPRRHRRVLPRLPRVHDPACGRPARTARRRSSRSGRCVRTARRRSSRRRRSTSRRSSSTERNRVRVESAADGGRAHPRPDQARRDASRARRGDPAALRGARARATRTRSS